MIPLWTPSVTAIQAANNNTNNNRTNSTTHPANANRLECLTPIEVSAVFVTIQTPQNGKSTESKLMEEEEQIDPNSKRLDQLVKVCVFLMGILVILAGVYYFKFCASTSPPDVVVLTIAAILIFLLGLFVFGHRYKHLRCLRCLQ